METSDSDYFESADEDVHSDDESVVSTKRPSLKLDEKNDTTLEQSVAKISIEDPSKREKNVTNVTNTQPTSEEAKNVEVPDPVSENLEPKEADDNLWEVDEINWETEGNLEETHDKIDKQDIGKVKSKQELNCDENDLWSDDEINWESEGHKEATYQKSESSEVDQKTALEEKSQEKHYQQSGLGSGWGNWGNWDVSSILNTATNSVSTLTAQVSQGISTVLEANIGIPDPEEIAKSDKEREITSRTEEPIDNKISPSNTSFGLGNIVDRVSHITKFVESTGTRVISGGLDTLETIGKKTMEVLQEGDPGLKKKRAFLKLDTGKPVLSQVLREAKEKAEQESQTVEEVEIKKFKNYETLFDDHQGLVHLEALEMLSKLCNMKLQNINDSLNGDALKDMQETMEQVKELCELPEDEEEEMAWDEIKEKIETAVKDLNVSVSYDKLVSSCEDVHNWLNGLNLAFITETELHQQAIEMLAQITALAVEQFHKIGELLLVKEHRSTADEADSLVQLTLVSKSIITKQAAMFCDKLNCLQIGDKDKVNELITNIFYEASNSCSYLHDAFQLLIPVLQVGLV